MTLLTANCGGQKPAVLPAYPGAYQSHTSGGDESPASTVTREGQHVAPHSHLGLVHEQHSYCELLLQTMSMAACKPTKQASVCSLLGLGC